MGWRRGEVWFEADVAWFGERVRPPFAFAGTAPALLGPPIPNGLAASRLRRANRRNRQRSRRAGAAALVVGTAAVIPLAVHRYGIGTGGRALAEDPPSLTFRFSPTWLALPPEAARRRARTLAGTQQPTIAWHHASSRGLPYGGSLVDGTQLPVEGPNWVTWNPVTDSVPNAPHRLYGNERTIRTILAVLAAYREHDPRAPRVVIGDISFKGGGPMDEHASHQNGLDVDIYYPRRDRALKAPVSVDQIDTGRAQDLVDRFVAAGAQMIFVGFHAGLHGPGGVVIPYTNHENHFHVRFPQPG